jgi:hypothetical protein
MNGDDVRVVQGRDGERFARESLAAIGIGRGDFRQNFQGDLALEPKIAGAVDLRPFRRRRAATRFRTIPTVCLERAACF